MADEAGGGGERSGSAKGSFTGIVVEVITSGFIRVAAVGAAGALPPPPPAPVKEVVVVDDASDAAAVVVENPFKGPPNKSVPPSLPPKRSAVVAMFVPHLVDCAGSPAELSKSDRTESSTPRSCVGRGSACSIHDHEKEDKGC